MSNLTTKKITLATIKAFIRKNESKIYIKVKSSFSGYTDCVEYIEDSFKLAVKDENINLKYTLGIPGAWFVGQSRDYFEVYEDKNYIGFKVYNACGSFIIAIKTEGPKEETPQIDGVLMEWHEGNGEFDGKTYIDLEILQNDLKQIYLDFVSDKFYAPGTYNKTKLNVVMSNGLNVSFRLDVGTNKGDFNPFQHKVQDAILEFVNSLDK